jgi:uncharacterized protein involved in exopolysaccharide biosynthesis
MIMNETNYQESEISLIDIFEFLKESRKTIAGVTVLGITGAALYLWAIPNSTRQASNRDDANQH